MDELWWLMLRRCTGCAQFTGACERTLFFLTTKPHPGCNISNTCVEWWPRLQKYNKIKNTHMGEYCFFFVCFWGVFRFKSGRPRRLPVPVCTRRWKAWYFTVTLFPFALLRLHAEARQHGANLKWSSFQSSHFKSGKLMEREQLSKATPHSPFPRPK